LHILGAKVRRETVRRRGPCGTAAKRAVGDLMDAIVRELKMSGKFTLPSFGTFTVRKMTAGKAT
jgi:nucleoid DNA-binding protein